MFLHPVPAELCKSALAGVLSVSLPFQGKFHLSQQKKSCLFYVSSLSILAIFGISTHPQSGSEQYALVLCFPAGVSYLFCHIQNILSGLFFAPLSFRLK